MNSRKLYIFVITILLLNTQISGSWISFFDYIWPNRNVRSASGDMQDVPKIPLEIGERDEKFILEASRVLGTRLSDQGFCEQRVIIALKNSCSSLDDEQVGKLSVMLMNCQLVSEGQATHECTESMPLADCLSGMDLEARQLFHSYQSRAKTVCLIIRQGQFRGMTEMTVNRLIDATHDNIEKMVELKKSQEQLQRSTLGSIDEISGGNLKLLDQQQELVKMGERHRINVNHIYRAGLRERSLLRGKHGDMMTFIADLKSRIQTGLADFHDQTVETQQLYRALLKDISDLHDATEKIINRLNEADQLVSEQNQRTKNDFKETVAQLKEVNAIVLNLNEVMREFRDEYREKMQWLSEQLGGNDENILKYLTAISTHIVYLLIGMLCLIFVNAPMMDRTIFLVIVSLSLIAVLYEAVPSNMAALTETIFLIFASKYSYLLSQKYDLKNYFKLFFKLSEPTENKEETAAGSFGGNVIRRNLNERRIEGNLDHQQGDGSETARRRTTGMYISHLTNGGSGSAREDDRQSDRSNSSTDLGSNRCTAITTRGVRCQLPKSGLLTEFCRLHDRRSYER